MNVTIATDALTVEGSVFQASRPEVVSVRSMSLEKAELLSVIDEGDTKTKLQEATEFEGQNESCARS